VFAGDFAFDGVHDRLVGEEAEVVVELHGVALDLAVDSRVNLVGNSFGGLVVFLHI